MSPRRAADPHTGLDKAELDALLAGAHERRAAAPHRPDDLDRIRARLRRYQAERRREADQARAEQLDRWHHDNRAARTGEQERHR